MRPVTPASPVRLTLFLKLAGLVAIVSGASIVHPALALPLGILGGWLIARSVGQRLEDMRDAVRGVAAADALPDAQPARRPGDPIDALSDEIATMAAAVRATIGARDELSRREQARLEAVAARRCQQLARRNRELVFVLDNVDQGVFLVDFAGRISGHHSAAVERLLGPLPSDTLLTSYVAQFAHEQAVWFEVCWASVRDGLLPPELALSQMPREFIVGGKHLELTYQIVNDRRADRVLVVVSDVTVRIERERAERDQRELAALVMRLLSDRTGFLEVHADIEQRCAAMERNRLTDLAALRRDAHTVKGTAAGAGILSLASACHELEDRLDDHDPATTSAAVERVVERWRELSGRIAPFVSSRTDRIEIAEAELEQLVAALRRLPGGSALAHVVESWRDEPVRARLERLAAHIRTLSATLGKGPVEIEVDADDTRIAADRWPELWGALVHVVRNAVDHGLETPEERVAAGKPLEAKIALRAASQGGDLMLQIEDHGRGIDWSRVAASARAAGLPATTHDDLVRALFSDGLTTRSAVTATSGRGVGLAAVQQACIDAGGDVRVDSREGLGTRFTFMLPAHAQAQSAARRAAGDRQ